MTERISLVDYLVLEDRPHLQAHECASCSARYFDRRNGCARCGGTDFADVDIDPAGTLRAYTIVSKAAPGIAVPFAAAVVECAGTLVRGNIINTEIDAANLRLGMEVRLAVSSIGLDDDGVEAVGFGFEPVGVSQRRGLDSTGVTS